MSRVAVLALTWRFLCTYLVGLVLLSTDGAADATQSQVSATEHNDLQPVASRSKASKQRKAQACRSVCFDGEHAGAEVLQRELVFQDTAVLKKSSEFLPSRG